MKKFKTRDLVSNILGINVTREGATGSIKLMKTKYIQNLLNKFNMTECKAVATPIESNTVLSKQIGPQTPEGTDEMKNIPYRELVGALIHLSNTTRPDLL